MKVIIINGQGGAGKDTFVELCKKEDWDIYVQNFSTVDFVKKIAEECGWKGEKTQESRLFLSNLKDIMTQYNDLPYYKVLEAIDSLLYKFYSYDISTNELVIFIHAREPADIKRWVKNLKARSLLIHRTSEGIFENHADRDVYTIDYDYTIVNNGTLDDLKVKAIEFIDAIRQEDWESIGYKEIFDIVQKWRFSNDEND